MTLLSKLSKVSVGRRKIARNRADEHPSKRGPPGRCPALTKQQKSVTVVREVRLMQLTQSRPVTQDSKRNLEKSKLGVPLFVHALPAESVRARSFIFRVRPDRK